MEEDIGDKCSAKFDSGKGEPATDHIIDRLQRRFQHGLPDDSTALRELCLDSLELVEVLFDLEQHTGRTLSNLELSSLVTLGDLIRFFSHPAEQEQ